MLPGLVDPSIHIHKVDDNLGTGSWPSTIRSCISYLSYSQFCCVDIFYRCKDPVGFWRHILKQKFHVMFRNQLDMIFRTKVHLNAVRDAIFECEGQMGDEYIVPEGQKKGRHSKPNPRKNITWRIRQS